MGSIGEEELMGQGSRYGRNDRCCSGLLKSLGTIEGIVNVVNSNVNLYTIIILIEQDFQGRSEQITDIKNT